MKAKDFFRQVYIAERELKLLKAQIQHFRDLGLSITGGGMDSPVVSHSRGSSRVEAAAMGIFDSTQKLEQQVKQYTETITKAQKVISQIQQEKFRQILTFKYLAGWSFRSISDELKYNDPKSVYRAHGFALKEAQKVLDKMTLL
jgi:hypothetical protein